MLFDFGNSSRSIYLFDAIHSWSAQSVIKDLLKMNSDGKEPINMFINSPGGLVTDALAIIDVMKAIEAPVNTIVLGKAASCGSLISASGDKRFISENSELMIHEAAITGYLNTRDKKLDVHFQRLSEINKKLAEIYSNASGKSVDEVSAMFSSKDDTYMTADESVKFGLVDTILNSSELSKIKLSEGFKSINLSEEFAVDEGEEEFKKVHLLKVCSLKERGVEITSETLLSLKANFESNVRGQDISIDYTHDNDDGEKKAGAWVKSLMIEEDNLYAKVEFTPTASQMIKDKEYKYLSVEIDPLYSDAEGSLHSNVLLGATFTNRPAVKGLDPIKLSENLNQTKTEMILSQEELHSVEALQATGVEIKDFHKSFFEMKSENELLNKANIDLTIEAAALKEASLALEASIEEAKNKEILSEKLSCVEALIEKGIIAPSQKEKVIEQFSSRSEVADFYKGVPASFSVQAAGGDHLDEEDLDSARLARVAKETGHSVENLKKFGFKQ